MATKLKIHQVFDVDQLQLAQQLLDPEFYAAKLAAVGGPGAALLSFDRDSVGGEVAVRLRQGVPRAALPGVVRGLLPGNLVIERSEHWTPSSTITLGEFTITVAHAPAEAQGTVTMTPADGGCEMRIDGTATITVPVVGRAIEVLVTDKIKWLMDEELQFTTEWMHEHAA